MEVYSKRVWLNKDSSRSTGSVVAFDGLVDYSDGPQRTMFLEVSDCHSKARLHMAGYDTKEDFIYKMKKLRVVLNEFINHLEN